MNAILISREYEPFFGGGIGSYTERFARALADEGHRATVVTVSNDGEALDEERAGVEVVRLPFIDGSDWSRPHPRLDTPEHRAAFETFAPVSLLAMQVARALPGLIETRRADFVEAPECGALAWFALNARRASPPPARAVPFLTHLHSPTAWIEEWNRDPGVEGSGTHLRAMERDSARWSDALVCPSRALASWARDAWGVGEAFHCAYPLGSLEREAREALRAPARVPGDGRRRVVFVGRLEARKGVDTLLAGFALAGARDPALELHLVGRDTRDRRSGMLFGERALRLLVPPELRPRVVVHGSVPPERCGELLDQGDAVIFPAPMDNFPCSCVEALARRRLVLATGVGGQAEMIRPGVDGLLFAPDDPFACARAIEDALAMTPARRDTLARSGTARILALCGNREVVRRRLEHVRSLADRPGTGRAAARARADAVLVRDAGGAATNSSDRRLRRAIEAGVDFAVGWARERDAPGVERVRALGTPDAEALTSHRSPLGTLAVEARWLDRPEVASCVERRGDGSWHARPAGEGGGGTLDLARVLAGLGARGASIPEACVSIDPPAREARP